MVRPSRSGAVKPSVRGRRNSRGITLQSLGARVEAVVEPRAGCAIVSLKINGREWLRLPEPLAAFLEHDRTGGVPLLFPWSNRLRSDGYQVLRERVDLRRGARVHRDGSGRPMHGLLLRWGAWTIDAPPTPESSDFRATEGSDLTSTDRTSFTATLNWSAHRELPRAFPFDFTLRLRYRVFGDGSNDSGLEIETEIESRETPVPLSFGWHPYLVLPGSRGACRVHAPSLSHVAAVDDLPRRNGGSLEFAAPSPLPPTLPRAGLDDLFAGVTDGMTIAVAGPRGRGRISVEFVRGYRFAQLYSPRGADFICIEPMMAPTAALSDAAADLPILGAHQRASALFRIVVRNA